MKTYLVLSMLVFSACGGSGDKNDASSETVHPNGETTSFSTIGLTAGCYQLVENGDTSTLNLQLNDTVVTGTITIISKDGREQNGQVNAVLRDSVLDGQIALPNLKAASFRLIVRNDSLLPQQSIIMPDPDRSDEFDAKTVYRRVNCKQ